MGNKTKEDYSKMTQDDFARLFLDDFLCAPRRVQELFFKEFHYPDGLSPFCPERFVFDFLEHGIESPIEQLFYFGYLMVDFAVPNADEITIEPQREIMANGNKYRVDFVISKEHNDDLYEVIIECDGHDYHKRTKEQIEYENQREYDLKMAGYDILHFSGSQLYKDPKWCAVEALVYLIKKFEERYEKY